MTTPTVKTLARQSIGPHQFLNPGLDAKLCASVSSLHAGSYTAINPGRCIAAIEVNSELFRVFRGPSRCSRKVCVTGPVKSEAQQAMEKGARCARRPGAGGERHQRTQRPLALQRRFTHRRPFHAPPPPGNIYSFVVALGATIRPSSSLFQSEPSQGEKDQQSWCEQPGGCSRSPLGRCLSARILAPAVLC